jgi:hypothetical protein
VFPDKKLSLVSGADATAAAWRFWETTVRFEARAVLADGFEEIRGDLEVVERDLAEQPAFKNWLLF